MKRLLEILLSNLFYLFFCAQILSPQVGTVTIYLENVIALANPFFLSWVAKRCTNQHLWMLFLAIGLCVVMCDYVLIPKVIVFAISIAYIVYSRERQLFYLFRYVGLSTLFAIAQFALLFVDPSLAVAIGPTNIAETVWGNYATGTFTNYYAVFALVRVGGLSREGGFFATLILNCILIYIIDRRERGYKSITVQVILFIGFVLSLSKMSLVLIPAWLVIKYRRWFDRIPFAVVPVLFSVPLMILVANSFEFLTEAENGTYLQRFGGFGVLFDLDVKQLLFGVEHLNEIPAPLAKAALSSPYDHMDYFAGFAGYILAHGLLGTCVTLCVLWLLGISPAGLLLLLLLTVNLDITTNQNFVTLTYFIIFTRLSLPAPAWPGVRLARA